jgi:hypothetical protein
VGTSRSEVFRSVQPFCISLSTENVLALILARLFAGSNCTTGSTPKAHVFTFKTKPKFSVIQIEIVLT